MRAFRFGVNMRTSASAAEWADRARKLEDQSYSTLCLPDHLAPMLAPLPALAIAAAATRRLRVGTMVLNNDFRHPTVLAREAATLDLLSDGRLELGLGAGHMKSEYDEAGLTFDRGAVRVARLAEAVVIVKRLFDGEPVTFHGQHYRLTGHSVHPRPVQRPRPPIFIGGNGPRLLALAAAEADIVGFTGITFARGGAAPDFSGFRAADVDARVGLVRETAGARFDRLELNALLQRVIVTDDRRAAAQELCQRWTALSMEDILGSPFVLLGSVDEIVADLEARRARWGLSYYVVQEPYADALNPVVARLAGR
jgi:probable F420-dependent oxidoreductase